MLEDIQSRLEGYQQRRDAAMKTYEVIQQELFKLASQCWPFTAVRERVYHTMLYMGSKYRHHCDIVVVKLDGDKVVINDCEVEIKCWGDAKLILVKRIAEWCERNDIKNLTREPLPYCPFGRHF